MRVIVIVLGLFGVAWGLPQQARIIGGEPTTIEKYPFMAGILRKSGEGIFYLSCGGTLISPIAIVSAANCFDEVAPADSKVRLGTNNNSTGGIEHTVSRISIHPEYHPALLTNNIVVLRLRNPAVYSDKIKSARIAGPEYALPADTVVYTLGWGDTKIGGPPSEILRHVAVNVIDQKICTERYEYLQTQPDVLDSPSVNPQVVCTGILDVGGKDACTGDSGGPVIHNKDILVGITSTGYECAHPFYPAINVRVSSYSDWIYTNSVN